MLKYGSVFNTSLDKIFSGFKKIKTDYESLFFVEVPDVLQLMK